MGFETAPPREEDAMGYTTEAPEKKKGFFRRLMKLAFIAAIVGGAVAFFKRRRGADLDDAEWQELPPPAGG
jgi:hypothetical protein